MDLPSLCASCRRDPKWDDIWMRQVASGKSIDVSPTLHLIQLMRDERGNYHHLWQEYCINLWTVLKMLQDPHSFNLARAAMNVQFAQFLGVCLPRYFQTTVVKSVRLKLTSKAKTLSENTMILSPRSSWYLIRNWHAWNFFGFMQ